MVTFRDNNETHSPLKHHKDFRKCVEERTKQNHTITIFKLIIRGEIGYGGILSLTNYHFK